MAKGGIAKEQITAQILQFFPNAFKYDKEIRIPYMENGEMVQIKVALTCAKTNVEPADGASPFNGAAAPIASADFPAPAAPKPTAEAKHYEPTEEEKKNLATLLESLGIEV